MKNNPKKTRARRLARWMNRLAQVKHTRLIGYSFYKGIPIPRRPTMPNNQHRETLPLWQWFSTEARYFLAEPEERQNIIILLTEELGEFAAPVLRAWDEDE